MLLGRPSRWPSQSAGPPRSVGAFGTDAHSVSPSFFLPPFRRDATTTDRPTGAALVRLGVGGEPDRCEH